MNVVLCHVYSATNRGDRLLAELAVELITESLGVRPDVVAVDPVGLEDLGGTIHGYGRTPRSTISAMRVAASTCWPRRSPELSAIEHADLVVGVGGAYLRTDDPRHVAVVAGLQLPQLIAAARSTSPWVMLPQSIGPMPEALHRTVDRYLRQATALHLRDDVSYGRYRSWAAAERTPDLAVLQAATLEPEEPGRRSGGRRVAVQLRPLPARPQWADVVDAWARSTDLDVVPTLQSTGGRLNDDGAFTRAVWRDDVEMLSNALDRPDRPGAAVCGRLHGALACIHHGVPAVHVAYERKSYGAFDDLGLEPYLVSPTPAGLREAERLCTELLDDPSDYWRRLDRRRPALLAARHRLTADIRRAAACV